LASTREKTGKCGCALKLILTFLPGGGAAGSEVVKMVLVMVTRSSAWKDKGSERELGLGWGLGFGPGVRVRVRVRVRG